jgi:hypothetical protein
MAISEKITKTGYTQQTNKKTKTTVITISIGNTTNINKIKLNAIVKHTC